MGKDYGSWSLANLKAELRKRKAKITGRKAILVQRLLEYDAMFEGHVDAPDTAYHINIPASEHFLDINTNSGIPNITDADIQQYSVLGERENLNKSKHMYEEMYLLSCRVAKRGDDHFIKGVCAAEMRKNVVYNIVIKIQNDTVMETQCECAAGMGPYAQCKHVLVLMYGLADFTANKKIKTRISPTSMLQTFHRPGHVYKGEPVEASNLKLKENDKNYLKIKLHDPRSTVMAKEKYTENFENHIINFASTANTSFPLQELRKPGNKLALFRDHNYLKKTMEEEYWDSIQLTDEQIKEFEEHTKNNSKIWKEARKMRLQSSNFGKIIKCRDINRDKLARSFLIGDNVVTLATKYGLKYEKIAIQKIIAKTGFQIEKCGTFIHKEHQFLASTPDGIIGDEMVVEVKCPYSAKNKQITSETVPYLYLCHETGLFKLDENHHYFYQVQGQMLCSGRKSCLFGVYTLSDLYFTEIKRDNDFIKNMTDKLKQFYNENYKHLHLCKYLYNIKI